MPRVELTATAHNQTGRYSGVTLREILTRVGVPSGADLRGTALAKTVIVTGADGYRSRSPLPNWIPVFTESSTAEWARTGCAISSARCGHPT